MPFPTIITGPFRKDPSSSPSPSSSSASSLPQTTSPARTSSASSSSALPSRADTFRLHWTHIQTWYTTHAPLSSSGSGSDAAGDGGGGGGGGEGRRLGGWSLGRRRGRRGGGDRRAGERPVRIAETNIEHHMAAMGRYLAEEAAERVESVAAAAAAGGGAGGEEQGVEDERECPCLWVLIEDGVLEKFAMWGVCDQHPSGMLSATLRHLSELLAGPLRRHIASLSPHHAFRTAVTDLVLRASSVYAREAAAAEAEATGEGLSPTRGGSTVVQMVDVAEVERGGGRWSSASSLWSSSTASLSSGGEEAGTVAGFGDDGEVCSSSSVQGGGFGAGWGGGGGVGVSPSSAAPAWQGGGGVEEGAAAALAVAAAGQVCATGMTATVFGELAEFPELALLWIEGDGGKGIGRMRVLEAVRTGIGAEGPVGEGARLAFAKAMEAVGRSEEFARWALASGGAVEAMTQSLAIAFTDLSALAFPHLDTRRRASLVSPFGAPRASPRGADTTLSRLTAGSNDFLDRWRFADRLCGPGPAASGARSAAPAAVSEATTRRIVREFVNGALRRDMLDRKEERSLTAIIVARDLLRITTSPTLKRAIGDLVGSRLVTDLVFKRAGMLTASDNFVQHGLGLFSDLLELYPERLSGFSFFDGRGGGQDASFGSAAEEVHSLFERFCKSARLDTPDDLYTYILDTPHSPRPPLTDSPAADLPPLPPLPGSNLDAGKPPAVAAGAAAAGFRCDLVQVLRAMKTRAAAVQVEVTRLLRVAAEYQGLGFYRGLAGALETILPSLEFPRTAEQTQHLALRIKQDLFAAAAHPSPSAPVAAADHGDEEESEEAEADVASLTSPLSALFSWLLPTAAPAGPPAAAAGQDAEGAAAASEGESGSRSLLTRMPSVVESTAGMVRGEGHARDATALVVLREAAVEAAAVLVWRWVEGAAAAAAGGGAGWVAAAAAEEEEEEGDERLAVELECGEGVWVSYGGLFEVEERAKGESAREGGAAFQLGKVDSGIGGGAAEEHAAALAGVSAERVDKVGGGGDETSSDDSDEQLWAPPYTAGVRGMFSSFVV
ncbi:hypothetical protein DFJ73DRAFT_921481 [Zopfochytrium polystomum]|nr:hypothetical protein DFJ73DRAFT_921481 [Zopfochytrium polystomum]